MKKLLLLIALAAGIFLVSCMPRNRVVENPLIELVNTPTLDIPKIELSDTATVLHLKAYSRPGSWIGIAPGACLKADGEKFAVQGSEGIELGHQLWLPESGEASFVVTFSPLPRGTKSFDFVESDDRGSFKLYEVDLTGKKEFPHYPEGLPEALRQEPQDGPVPDPILKMGETTLRVHLLGYRDAIFEEVIFDVSSLPEKNKLQTAPVDTLTGIATLRFEQYGPTQITVRLANDTRMVSGTIWTAPGETLDVYFDLQQTGRTILERRSPDLQPVPRRKIYSTGTYGDLNMLYNMNNVGRYRFDCFAFTRNFLDYRVSADEFVEAVEAKYKALADDIARNTALSAMVKELSLISLQQEMLLAINCSHSLLLNDYLYKNNINPAQADTESIGREIAYLEPEHYLALGKYVDLYDPKLLMGLSLSDYRFAAVSNGDLPDIVGARDSFFGELGNVGWLFGRAKDLRLTPEDIERLQACKEPFFALASEAMQAHTRKVLEENEKVRIEPTPAVSNEQLFDAIVAPYKGKVVFVDFWGTWCVPCVAAIKTMEPLKTGELKSDDLIWIYLADDTSPLATYKEYIADIQGKHFWLTEKQWRYLWKKFGIETVPAYVLVEKDGSYALRTDLRDHGLLKRTLREKIK